MFTFASQCVEAGATETDRSVLANNNGTIVIPNAVTGTLRAATLEPTPVHHTAD